MKIFPFIILLFIALSPRDSKAADCLTALQNLVFDNAGTEVSDLPRTWISPGTHRPAHYRLTKYPNGLRYVTIHDEHGRQIFNDKAEVKASIQGPDGVWKTETFLSAARSSVRDLGDGFKLSYTTSFDGGTMSRVEKEIKGSTAHGKLFYTLKPISETEIKNLSMNYKIDTMGYIIEIELQHFRNQNQKFKISVIHKDSQVPGDMRHSRLEFEFDKNGRLIQTNMKRIESGSKDVVIHYYATDPRGPLFFSGVFGKPVVDALAPAKTNKADTNLPRIIPIEQLIDKIMSATMTNSSFDLKSLRRR